MPKGKQPPPRPKGRSREELFNAETSITSTDDPEDKKSPARRQKGERVEAPAAELMPQGKHDWSKTGVLVALGLAAAGTIYSYADLVWLARNTAEDVKELELRADALLRSSLDASARITVLERREATAPLPPSASAPARNPSR